jgi:cellulose synthase operon protein C
MLETAGRAMAATGDYQQAISTLSKLASLVPQSPGPYLKIADVQRRRGDSASALLTLFRALEVAPASDEVHTRVAVAAREANDFERAFVTARAIQRKYPNASAGFALEGELEMARKRLPAAIDAYRKALGKSDPTGRAGLKLYGALKASGDQSGASRFASERLRARPRDLALLEAMAGTALLQRDFVVAERHYRDLLVDRPDSASGLNNLAWLMAERAEKGAIKMAERAVALSQGSPAALDTLAKAHAAAAQWDRAIEVQRSAIALSPDRKEYQLNLAQTLVKAGRSEEARKVLVGLKALGASFPHQKEVAEALRSIS